MSLLMKAIPPVHSGQNRSAEWRIYVKNRKSRSEKKRKFYGNDPSGLLYSCSMLRVNSSPYMLMLHASIPR